ncbi:hypothetical protein J2X36_000855, partial [Methylobacterium sp. BE186]|nr:hypothetical protein [Methylobacterium sp. BE186]
MSDTRQTGPEAVRAIAWREEAMATHFA